MLAIYNLSLTAESEPMMTKKKDIYRSFLIRICSDEDQQVRRVTVTRVSETGEQHYFTTLDDLMIFLLQEIESSPKGGWPIT